jgi:hypothetical protein
MFVKYLLPGMLADLLPYLQIAAPIRAVCPRHPVAAKVFRINKQVARVITLKVHHGNALHRRVRLVARIRLVTTMANFFNVITDFDRQLLILRQSGCHGFGRGKAGCNNSCDEGDKK